MLQFSFNPINPWIQSFWKVKLLADIVHAIDSILSNEDKVICFSDDEYSVLKILFLLN